MDGTFEPHGENDLRVCLENQGFLFAPKGNQWRDQCNWYAYGRSALPARRCECNSDTEGMQITITPSSIAMQGCTFRDVEIELCGEAGGVWWKLKAHSIKPEDVKKKLDEIEASLIAAWNALRPQREEDTWKSE